MSKAKLTVFFEEPFWVGLYEREEDGRYEVARVTFGAEPRDCEVYAYFLSGFHTLRFSPSVEAAAETERRVSPKRRQRLAQKAVEISGIGTKAQQALSLQREQGKLEHKTRSREQREAEAERRFQCKARRRREKHRGH